MEFWRKDIADIEFDLESRAEIKQHSKPTLIEVDKGTRREVLRIFQFSTGHAYGNP
jgi:hypothetical protein